MPRCLDERANAAAADIDHSLERDARPDKTLRRNCLDKRLEKLVDLLGGGVLFGEIGFHEPHAAGRIGIIYLREDVVFGGDGRAGRVLPPGLRVDIGHRRDVMEKCVIRSDTLELFKG